MFNKQELEFLYVAVNGMPVPQSTQGGRAKAHMIAKLCDELDKAEAAAQEAKKQPSKKMWEMNYDSSN